VLSSAQEPANVELCAAVIALATLVSASIVLATGGLVD